MRSIISFVLIIALVDPTFAQGLRIPDPTNLTCVAGRKVGTTDITIRWNAPGVKGRQGKIWGTDIAYYGFSVLGFGSNTESPWRAGADECTTIEFSTEVNINGKILPTGKYAFFIALYPDSAILIFNKNVNEWGSYFYDVKQDVLRVKTSIKKEQPSMVERLTYNFYNHTANSIEVQLEWENWAIPFTITVDSKRLILENIRSQMSGALGFDPPSLQAAADWCVRNEVNYEEALNWINSATMPSLGGINSFSALNTKSKLLFKLNRQTEADETLKKALEVATILETHNYGRQLLNEKKIDEGFTVLENNYKKYKGAWPTNAGMMRAYNAKGDYKKALEFAKAALLQTTDEGQKKVLNAAIENLKNGKPI